MLKTSLQGRLAVDVGGTFTDVALEFGSGLQRYPPNTLRRQSTV